MGKIPRQYATTCAMFNVQKWYFPKVFQVKPNGPFLFVLVFYPNFVTYLFSFFFIVW